MQTNVWSRLRAAITTLFALSGALLARSSASSDLAAPELSLGASLLKTGLSLGAVIVLLVLALRLVARWNNAAARPCTQRRIEVLESRRLEAKRSLHVVRIEGRRWLVASCEGAMQLQPLLGEDAAPPQDATGDAHRPRGVFASLFLRREVGAEVNA